MLVTVTTGGVVGAGVKLREGSTVVVAVGTGTTAVATVLGDGSTRGWFVGLVLPPPKVERCVVADGP